MLTPVSHRNRGKQRSCPGVLHNIGQGVCESVGDSYPVDSNFQLFSSYCSVQRCFAFAFAAISRALVGIIVARVSAGVHEVFVRLVYLLPR